MNKLVLNFEDVIVHSEHSDKATVFRIPRSYKYYTDKENKIDTLVISHPSLKTEMLDNKSKGWEMIKDFLESRPNEYFNDVQLDGCIYVTMYENPVWRIIPSELYTMKNKQDASWRELNKSYINNAGIFPYTGQSDNTLWDVPNKTSLKDYENSPVKEVLVTLSEIEFPEDLSLFGDHLYNHCLDEYCVAESIEDDSGTYDETMNNLFNIMEQNNYTSVDVPKKFSII